MNEQLLQYIWKFRLLKPFLETTGNESLNIVHPGIQNSDGGPDFINARIRIGRTLWAGNVEVHLKASDWLKHRHLEDPAYDNVILHVVYDNDLRIRQNHRLIPALELKDKIAADLEKRYTDIMKNSKWIPCSGYLNGEAEQVIRLWAPVLVTERLEMKYGTINALLDEFGNWDEAAYVFLCSGFGFRINSLPFEILGRSLPLRIIRKNLDSRLRVETLLLGQSGLLANHSRDKFLRSVIMEFCHLKAKYRLKPLSRDTWKYLRLRPANFPEIRISQLADCLFKSKTDFNCLFRSSALPELMNFFNVETLSYWHTHFRTGKKRKKTEKRTGDESVALLIINIAVPLFFAYGYSKSISPLVMRAMETLEALMPESNHDISEWKTRGIHARNALETQALLQLKRNYCDKKRCLECRIGLKILHQ